MRTVSGTGVRPADMNRSFAALLTIWSAAMPMKSDHDFRNREEPIEGGAPDRGPDDRGLRDGCRGHDPCRTWSTGRRSAGSARVRNVFPEQEDTLVCSQSLVQGRNWTASRMDISFSSIMLPF